MNAVAHRWKSSGISPEVVLDFIPVWSKPVPRRSIAMPARDTTATEHLPEIDQSFSRASLEEIFSELREIIQEEDEEFRPSKQALITTFALLIGADTSFDTGIPYGSVAPDGEGGIRIEWWAEDREVRLVVASSEAQPSYIYHEVDGEYGIDERVSEQSLVKWLRWAYRV